MSKFAIRFGHQATGSDGASIGILKEFNIIREYGPYIISGLQRLGHEVLDVTPPENNRSLADSLMYGINKANEWGADYFISCHANCEVPSARGCEVVYGSSSGRALAETVVNELTNLGFPKHQGAYLDQRGLAEIRNTDMVTNIIEPFFVSNSDDVALYRKIGPEKLGYAIVKGLTGQDVQGVSNNKQNTVTQTAATYEETVPTGDNIYQIPNMPFYIEKRTDGDMSIHLDRGNYMTLRKGGAPEVYWNNNKGSGGSKRLF